MTLSIVSQTMVTLQVKDIYKSIYQLKADIAAMFLEKRQQRVCVDTVWVKTSLADRTLLKSDNFQIIMNQDCALYVQPRKSTHALCIIL